MYTSITAKTDVCELDSGRIVIRTSANNLDAAFDAAQQWHGGPLDVERDWCVDDDGVCATCIAVPSVESGAAGCPHGNITRTRHGGYCADCGETTE